MKHKEGILRRAVLRLVVVVVLVVGSNFVVVVASFVVKSIVFKVTLDLLQSFKNTLLSVFNRVARDLVL
jgi:hypothetical protein